VNFSKARRTKQAFMKQKGKKLLFQDPEEDDEYSDSVNVWSCFRMTEAKIIAKHMTSGTLIISLDRDDEVGGQVYYKLTPGRAKVTIPKVTYD
jgi:hypothetical protein